MPGFWFKRKVVTIYRGYVKAKTEDEAFEKIKTIPTDTEHIWCEPETTEETMREVKEKPQGKIVRKKKSGK